MTKQIRVGSVPIGGGAPVTIQSMTNTPTHDVEVTLAQIRALASAGCDIVRVAVPDMASARAVGKIKENCPLPLEHPHPHRGERWVSGEGDLGQIRPCLPRGHGGVGLRPHQAVAQIRF